LKRYQVEKRFKKDTNHVISKAIISKAKGTTRDIVLEDLKNIRQSLEQRLRIKLTDIQIGHFDNSEIL
jgi:putative transposase